MHDAAARRRRGNQIDRLLRIGRARHQHDAPDNRIPAPRVAGGVRKLYGTSGNSFVAVVEFGERVRAKAITAAGESGDPASPHFEDQALRYTTGELRDVYYYPDQLAGHTARRYHPGE